MFRAAAPEGVEWSTGDAVNDEEGDEVGNDEGHHEVATVANFIEAAEHAEVEAEN